MQALTFFFAFVAVLALIGVAAWLVRRFAGNRLGANTNRGRMPRLAVIDAAAVDGRRRLVLVRRDNVEHLLMIGGPTDIVVEPNIVRAMPGRDQMPPRPAVGAPEPPPRIAPLPDASWAEAESPRARHLRSCRAANAGAAAAAGPALFCRRSAAPGAGAGTARRALRAPIRWPASRRSRSAAVRSRRSSRAANRCHRARPARSEPVMPRPPRPSEAPKAPPLRAPERAAAAAAASAPAVAVDRGPESRRDGAAAGGRASPAGRPTPVAPPVAPEPPPAARAAQRARAPPVAPPAEERV